MQEEELEQKQIRSKQQNEVKFGHVAPKYLSTAPKVNTDIEVNAKSAGRAETSGNEFLEATQIGGGS